MKALLAGLATVAVIAVFATVMVAFRNQEPGASACAATLRAGDDVTAALFRAAAGDTICLEAGTHRPISTSRVRPGITLRGAGPDQTVIRADGGSGIEIVD